VRGFDQVLIPVDFLLDAEEFDDLDPLYLWPSRRPQGLESAGWRPGEVPAQPGLFSAT